MNKRIRARLLTPGPLELIEFFTERDRLLITPGQRQVPARRRAGEMEQIVTNENIVMNVEDEAADRARYRNSVDLLKQLFDSIPEDTYTYWYVHKSDWVGPHEEKWQRAHEAVIDVLIEYDDELKAMFNADAER